MDGALAAYRQTVLGGLEDVENALVASTGADQRTAQLEKVMEGLSPLKQRAFADAVVAYDGVVQERSDRIAASLANWEADQAKAAHERTVKLEEARGIFAREQAEMARAFAVEGNDEHNTRVTAALAEARRNFESDLPMPRLAQMTMRPKGGLPHGCG